MFDRKPKTLASMGSYNIELSRLIQQQQAAYSQAKRTHEAFKTLCDNSRTLLDQMKRELDEAVRIQRRYEETAREAKIA